MKLNRYTLAIMLIAISFLLRPTADAAEFEFQPRLETGLMYYSIEQTPKSTISQVGATSISSLAQEKIEFSDNIGFVGGGGTLFIRRLFVDFGGQYAFNGSGRTRVADAAYSETENLYNSTDAEYHFQLDRTDLALSAGYMVNRRFSVYAGYKWATVDMDVTFEGTVGVLNIDNIFAFGHVKGKDHYKFQYEGPFIGVTHGWEIDPPGVFNGMISAKVALALLSSKYSADRTGAATYTSINGMEIEPVAESLDEKRAMKGDSLGLTLGFDWHGRTAIESLSYWIGLSGYRYNFDADDSSDSDVNETAVTLKAGLSYVY